MSAQVDYLKYDNCFNQGQSGTPKISYGRYNVMPQALSKTNYGIIYAICNWGNDDPYDWAYLTANSGRMSGDIYNSFSRPDDRCPCTEAPRCAWPGFHCKYKTACIYTVYIAEALCSARLRYEHSEQDSIHHKPYNEWLLQ
jgi:hypothetical protein